MKVLIVDDEPELACRTNRYLTECGITFEIILIQTGNQLSYEKALKEIFAVYQKDPTCIVLMDYNMWEDGKNTGSDLVKALIEKGMLLENFIAVSSSFVGDNGCQKVPGLYCDFDLRRGEMSQETMKRLGLLTTEEFKLPDMLV